MFKNKNAANPLQPMLILFPIIFFIATFISFLTYQIYAKVFWFHLGYTANVAGVLTALVALFPAVTAWWSETPNHPYEQKEGMLYVSFTGLSILLFVVDLWMEADQWDLHSPIVGAATFVAGFGLISAFVAAYFGWDLEQKYEVSEEVSQLDENSRGTPLRPSYRH